MLDKLFVVGLTGPTGSGKGAVAKALTEWNIAVIDTDQLARKVVEPGSACLEELVGKFSNEILNHDGTLNRRELARRAFENTENENLLNSITHPYIIDLTMSILMRMKENNETVAVIDAPLLFESGMDKICDLKVSVIAPFETRLQRILQRDTGLDEKQARARMAAQQPDEYYLSKADIIIENNGELESLRRQADELANTIREWAHGKE